MIMRAALKIAIVEDDSGVRTALQQLLRSGGFDAVTFASAEEFLAHDGGEDFACLIADINLPGISGVDLVETLGAAGHVLPAILITGGRDAATAELTRQAGDMPTLYKPFTDAALFAAIGRFVNTQSVTRVCLD
jgi:FixJ family two-component response regulator